MDGVGAVRTRMADEEGGRRVARARALIKELTPEKRAAQVKKNLRSHAALIVKLADAIQLHVAEKRQLQEEVDRRGRWALDLDQRLRERDSLILRLQSESHRRIPWMREMERKLRGMPILRRLFRQS